MSAYEIFSAVAVFLGMALIALSLSLGFRSAGKQINSRISSGNSDGELLKSALRHPPSGGRRRVAGRIIFALFALLVGAFLLVSLLTRLNGGRPVAGIGAMAVASGSMSEANAENTYLGENDLVGGFDKYALIFIESVGEEDELSLGDVVAYTNPDGVIIIHRIVGMTERDGQTRYIMRGDANGANDAYRPAKGDVIGRYTGFNIPLVGAAVLFLGSFTGIVTAVSLIVLTGVAQGAYSSVIERERRRKAYLREVLGVNNFSGEIVLGQSVYVVRCGIYVGQFAADSPVAPCEAVRISADGKSERIILSDDEMLQ